ncbi:MAG: MBL fold metallo-hydrolase [Planctomycetota bacterium]
MAGSALQIDSRPLGAYQTNCYTVRHGEHLWVVDAGFEPAPLLDLVDETGLVPELLLLTHAHPDHIAGIPDLRRAFPGMPVAVHSAEQRWLTDPDLNLSSLMGEPVSVGAPDRLLEDGERLSLGALSWHVRHTPGHSPGSLSFVCDSAPVVIAGDALFAGSVGRTDFPNSDPETLAASIRTGLYTLPDETTVFPGHGPSTTIGHEKASNPFVQPEA